MNGIEEKCDTTLAIGTGVGIKREKQSKDKKRGLWLDLSLPLYPKIKADDRDHENNIDDEKVDHDSFCSKTIDDDEGKEDRSVKRSISNTSVCNNNDGSRKKLKLTTKQTTVLEESFKISSTLNTCQKQELAMKLNLLPRQIEVWFQNRRARTKLKQIEHECELLKKCCETLGDENRKLKEELQKVRYYSLKLDQHHHPLAHQPSLPFCIPSYPITKTAMRYTGDNNGKNMEDKKTVVVNGSTEGQ